MWVPNLHQVHLALAPVDMRIAHDGLAAKCRQELDADPLSGQLFVFFNKGRTRVKVFYWDGTGLCLFYKRLEVGHFTHPKELQGRGLSEAELRLLLEGADLTRKWPLTPDKLEFNCRK